MINVNKRSGFTMTELMAVVAIVGILVVAAVPLLNNANQNIMMSKTRLSLQQDARNIMSLITRVLREAKTSTVSISRHNSSQPFYSKITFSTIDNKNYQFYQSGKNLYMADGTNVKILTSDLRYLAFAFPESSDMSIVSLSLTLEKELFSGRRKALHMASEKVMLMND
ncbi:MAG: type II secretion system protein [Elusimicrobiales bacterium]|nr:type II secretion system protein [Elusimicrobiales bacterium]HOL62125.1 type II secretion system protein [Elusimicrobiales bacterium]HPO94712.1 type II secretion system protein [Elusimicrobiales bacterium]